MHTNDENLKNIPPEMKDFLATCRRMKDFPFNKAFAGGLSGKDHAVLFETHNLLLKCEPGAERVRVSAIVNQMQVPAPLVSRNLKNLEGKGLILSEADPEDRRNTLVSLTPEGRELLRRSEAVKAEFMTGVVNEMGNEEMKKLTASMSLFLDCMERELEKFIH